MNHKMIRYTMGMLLLLYAAFLALPMIAALCYRESVLPFLAVSAGTALAGFLLRRKVPERKTLCARDGFVIVSLAWIIMSVIGALPFVISGDIPNFIDAVFETASGLSTTGSTIMTDVESMSRSGMFWRMFTHWIGGMGVLVFMLAVMPMDGDHSMHIMRAEVPGPTVGKLVPRVRETAKILYAIYAGMTLLEMILLLFGGMSFYDALLHAVATAGTGGFSTRAASIGAYNSVYIEVVIGTFMILFGVNFNLYYLILIGRAKDALRSEELKVYAVIIVVSVLSIAAGIAKMYGGFAAGLRHAFFNVATLISSTGFGTVDFTQWPEYCKWILIGIMFCGACAGSTGGGIKVSRIMIYVKMAITEMRAIANPRSISRVRMEGKCVDDDTLHSVSTFLLLYLGALLLGAFLLSFDGYDIETTFTAMIAALSNMGPGMGLVGPAGNYAIFSPFSKVVLTLAMLMGRLEFFPMVVLFSPRTWKQWSGGRKNG